MSSNRGDGWLNASVTPRPAGRCLQGRIPAGDTMGGKPTFPVGKATQVSSWA